MWLHYLQGVNLLTHYDVCALAERRAASIQEHQRHVPNIDPPTKPCLGWLIDVFIVVKSIPVLGTQAIFTEANRA